MICMNTGRPLGARLHAGGNRSYLQRAKLWGHKHPYTRPPKQATQAPGGGGGVPLGLSQEGQGLELEPPWGGCGLNPVTPACLEPPALSQVLPDREGKRCMFCVKTASRTYEMSASDTRQRQEWTAGGCSPVGLNLTGPRSSHL